MLSSIRLRPLLYAIAIALSAALLFVIEPAAAKALLPEFGGSAGVWIACVLFFQVTLLLGYRLWKRRRVSAAARFARIGAS